MENLGLFGIYQESLINIFLQWKKIFSHISLTLILPLVSFVFVIFKQLSDILIEYEKLPPQYDNIEISFDSIMFLFFNLICFAFIFIFSILSTSAVVYTAASIHTARKTSFVKVMSIVPKASKRLMVTFFCNILDFLAYNFLQVLVMLAITTSVRKYCGEDNLTAMYVTMAISYLIGFVYESVIWKLASVVTLLEDSCGFEAMTKSKELVKGKLGVSIIIFLSINVPLFVIQILLVIVAMGKWELLLMVNLGYVGKIGFAIMCFLVSCHLLSIELVLQTVLYFVCKSNHGENIDMDALSELLERSEGDREGSLLKEDKDVNKDQDHL